MGPGTFIKKVALLYEHNPRQNGVMWPTLKLIIFHQKHILKSFIPLKQEFSQQFVCHYNFSFISEHILFIHLQLR